MRVTRVAVATSTTIAVLALALGALRADEAKAGALFHDGEAAYARRDYRVAGEAFEAAYREAPSGAAMYAAGLAWEAGGDAVHAANDYERAAAQGGLGKAEGKDLDTRLAKLKKQLGHIEVRAPGAKITVDDRAAVDAPFSGYALPGAHSIVVVFPNAEKRVRAVHVDAGQALAIDLDAPAAPPVASPASAAPSTSAPPLASAVPSATSSSAPVPPPPSSGSPMRTAGFVVLAVGGVLAIAGVPLGVAALGARDTFNASGYRDASAHDRAATLKTLTNVAWIAGGVAIAGGFTLVLVAPSKKASAERARAVLQLGLGSIDVRGAF